MWSGAPRLGAQARRNTSRPVVEALIEEGSVSLRAALQSAASFEAAVDRTCLDGEDLFVLAGEKRPTARRLAGSSASYHAQYRAPLLLGREHAVVKLA